MDGPKASVSPKWFFRLVDALALLIAFEAAYLLLPRWGPALNPHFAELDANNSAMLLLLSLPLWLLLLDWGGMYADPVYLSYVDILRGMFQVSLFALASLTLVVFGVKEQGISRLLVFSFTLFSFASLSLVRMAEKRYYGLRHQAGYYARDLLVIGAVEDIGSFERFVTTNGGFNHFRIHPLKVSEPGSEVSGHSQKTWSLELPELLARQPLDEVIVILSPSTETRMNSVEAVGRELGQAIRLIPGSILRYCAADAPRWPVCAESFLGLPSLVLPGIERKPLYEFIKRLVDISISSFLLLLLAPFFLLLGLAVRISSPGPILYRWRVLGQNNREFTGFKFRTMVANADQLKAGLLKANEMTGPVFKMKNDPRVTVVGRALRKYSLDELPQLWNVLKGDMSLVGPRPPLRGEFERFEFWQTRKLRVKPGITCLWQISGRNEIRDFDDWIRLDLEYIDRRSLWLDVQILARTVLAVLGGTGR